MGWIWVMFVRWRAARSQPNREPKCPHKVTFGLSRLARSWVFEISHDLATRVRQRSVWLTRLCVETNSTNFTNPKTDNKVKHSGLCVWLSQSPVKAQPGVFIAVPRHWAKKSILWKSECLEIIESRYITCSLKWHMNNVLVNKTYTWISIFCVSNPNGMFTSAYSRLISNSLVYYSFSIHLFLTYF